MKLVYPEWTHQIVFKEGEVSLLIIENPKLMYEYVNDFVNQCNKGIEGRFVLSDNDKILNLEKNMSIILNPFELDINNRKILTKLYSELKKLSVDEDLYIESNQLLSEIEKYMEKLIDESDYNMEYDIDVDFTALFKMFNLRLKQESTTLLESIIDYLSVMQQILCKNIFVCINLKCYLSEVEMKQLYEMADYKKISLLLIEGRQPEQILTEEKMFIIDKMGCEIY